MVAGRRQLVAVLAATAVGGVRLAPLAPILLPANLLPVVRQDPSVCMPCI